MKEIRDLDTFPFVASEGWQVQLPRAEDLSAMRNEAEATVGLPLAPLHVLERLYGSESARFVAFYNGGRPAGGSAALLLSSAGLRNLKSGHFNFHFPSEADLAQRDAQPAAIYWWVIWGSKVTSHALAGLVDVFKEQRTKTADIYAVPFTTLGERFLIRLGFEAFECRVPRMMRYTRKRQGYHDYPDIKSTAILNSDCSQSIGHNADRFGQVGYIYR